MTDGGPERVDGVKCDWREEWVVEWRHGMDEAHRHVRMIYDRYADAAIAVRELLHMGFLATTYRRMWDAAEFGENHPADNDDVSGVTDS